MTKPKVRAAIQASAEPASVLAERFGATEQAIYKWKHRDTVHDRTHTPHRLQTTLTPAQEAVAVVLRKTLLVSLDDLLALAIGLEPMAPPMARCGEFLNPDVSRVCAPISPRMTGYLSPVRWINVDDGITI